MRINDDQVQDLHQCSLRILDEIGVRFANDKALATAREFGCRVEGEVVRFSPDQISQLIEKAPSQFVLQAQNPKYNAVIGGDTMEFLSGYGAPTIMDMEGKTRPAHTGDYINFLKMIEAQDHFHINGGLPVQPTDLPPDQATVLMLAASLRHSQKGLLIPNAHGEELDLVFEILGAWFGKELEEKVWAMTLVNSLSPLQYDCHALENCMGYAQRGQALIVSGGALIGATGVLSLAGSFAQANAETLAGIALAQMVNPGTPVVFGLMSSVSDMATGTAAIGCPEKALATHWNRRLAQFYNLPCRAGGTDNDAMGVNVQAGMESMFSMGATAAAGTHLVLHAAGTMAGYAAISYEKFMADLDILSMIKVFQKGIEVNEETLAFDTIKEVGIGGQYLTHAHTFAHCRNTIWPPTLGVRRASQERDTTQELATRALKARDNLLASYQRPAIDPSRLKTLDRILKTHQLDDQQFFSPTD